MRLRTLVKSGEAATVGVGASEAARALGMAPALAKEQLLAAESQGLFWTEFILELEVHAFVFARHASSTFRVSATLEVTSFR